MDERLLYLYCRARAGASALRERVAEALWPPEERWEEGQAGLSELATTVILVAVGVALVVAVIAILGPRIVELAQGTGENIDSVPLEWGE